MARPRSAGSLRGQAIAEWRGYAEPRPLHDGVQALGASITKAMLGLGLGTRVKEAEVIQAWAEIVGPFIATHSSPAKLKDGVLYVSVLQPTIHFELERVWKSEIIRKMKARFGSRTVREVRFRLG
jgi:predicted nucleic acid-binding Zn ribbon protein